MAPLLYKLLNFLVVSHGVFPPFLVHISTIEADISSCFFLSALLYKIVSQEGSFVATFPLVGICSSAIYFFGALLIFVWRIRQEEIKEKDHRDYFLKVLPELSEI